MSTRTAVVFCFTKDHRKVAQQNADNKCLNPDHALLLYFQYLKPEQKCSLTTSRNSFMFFLEKNISREKFIFQISKLMSMQKKGTAKKTPPAKPFALFNFGCIRLDTPSIQSDTLMGAKKYPAPSAIHYRKKPMALPHREIEFRRCVTEGNLLSA